MFVMVDATDVTSDSKVKHGNQRAWVFASGTGTVKVERRAPDGNWYSYPETTFPSPCARVLEIGACEVRVKVEGGPLMVEVRS